MTKPSISQVENAFQPAREITGAVRFAGRKQAVSDLYYALLSEGANIAIVGNRGIGKTSLARQLANLSKGDNSILERLALPHDHSLDYLTIYLACGNSINSTEALLESLLTSTSCLADWIYDVPKAKKIMTGYSPKFGANIFGISAELGGEKKEEIQSEHAISSHGINSVFANVAIAITEEGVARDGLLIIVDEFDQISDTTGFASFLKALATNAPKVKFCIVGVAKDIQMLMKEHASADRLFAGSIIALPSMTLPELIEIVDIAEREIGEYIVFDKAAKEKLSVLAQGHPYMVHLVGKYALRLAYHEDRRVITAADIDLTLKSIAERQADPVLEGRYRTAVASSPQRESVLRALAATQDTQGEIWTTNTYKRAIEDGVDNPSQYVGHLATDQYGAELENLRERFYRFKDSLFAAYVCARPRMFPQGT